ncbi:hypothetical protein CEQ83_02175 [Priestia megaterium]|uniref:hypothetical protein n=1 Tax=Priestia megaterium TaxID=1404 RepID=UPI0012A83FC8|nr:hypothetical protein [Priestia megaterium]QFY75844.1 hypothetical protein CEQ83_02175 [Priestia megaterium]
MTATLSAKQDILAELKQGNTAVLKGLPPSVAMSYGLALQAEVGQTKDSPINSEAVGTAVLDMMDDSDVKERIIKQMEENKKVTSR